MGSARYARAVHLRFDVGPAGLAFNDAGVFIASDVPPGGATPYLPLPVPAASLQLWAGGDEVARTPTVEVPEGEGALLVAYGTSADPRGLALSTPIVGAPGTIRARVVHTTPGLPYAGLVVMGGGQVAGLTYGGVSPTFTVAPDREVRWAFDLNGDGRPDLPLVPWELPAVDSGGLPQTVEIFVIPTGQTLPGPAPLPVPALLVVPLDAPDGIFVVPPDAG